MTDLGDLTRQLADVQKALWDLPEGANEERFALGEKQAALRAQAAQYAERMYEGRSTEDLLTELSALRSQMIAIERQRIDLVVQAGSTSAGEMGNLGGYGINKGIEDAMGMPKIKTRIGLLKGTLTDRGVDVPDAD